jgi:2-dehydropantoate 2-reductase
VEIIAKRGIQLDSVIFGNFVARPKALSRLDHTPDILFVTTKATTLQEALERVNPSIIKNTVIIPLLNGLEHMQVLQARYGKCVVAASISIEVIRHGINQISHTTPFARIKLASDGDISAGRLSEIAQFLSNAGIETKVLESEAVVLWEKLVRLNAIACTTSASNRPLGFIRSDPWWRKQLEGCAREGAAVATADGAKTDSEAVMAQIDALPATLTTSMQRDIAAGELSELDAIAGAVVRAGAKHGIACPTIENLIKMIKSRIVEGEHS